MASLIEKFNERVSKSKIPGIANEASFDVLYSTGFLSIDYLNGTVVHVDGADRKFSYDSTGIVDGSSNAFIGRSGSGKSTLIIQTAGNIVRPFIEAGMPADVFIDDIEGSLPQSRKEFLLGLTQEQLAEHCKFRNTGINTENVLERIKLIHEVKTTDKSYRYDTGKYDTYGKRIFKLCPTVYIIDSIPQLLPQDISDDEDLMGNMDGSKIAKSNTMFVKKVTQLCKEANIILLSVNHILDEISTGFIPKPSQISGLKQGERMAGGKAFIYLANNMFRTDDSLTLKADKDLGIDGSVVNVTLIKSRTNATKRSVPMIFNKTEGYFDNTLSLFYLVKSEGIIKGVGQGMYFDELPEVKFSQKNFKTVLSESPELQKVFAKHCYSILSSYLSETRNKSVENRAIENNIVNLFDEFAMARA